MKQVIEKLRITLADTYSLYLKTQNYHWNVVGEEFFQLHEAFENQYGDLAEAVDTLAERIRALGEQAPGSFKAFDKLRTLKDAKEKASWKEMVKDLCDDHVALSKAMHKLCGISQKAGDEVTADIMIQRMAVHDKTAWMLRSLLGK